MLMRVLIVIILVINIQCKKRQAPQPRQKPAITGTSAKQNPEIIKDDLIKTSNPDNLDPSAGINEQSKSIIKKSEGGLGLLCDTSCSNKSSGESSLEESASKTMNEVSGKTDRMSIQDSRESNNNSESPQVLEVKKTSIEEVPNELSEETKLELAEIGQKFKEVDVILSSDFQEKYSQYFLGQEANEQIEFNEAFKEKFNSNYIPLILDLKSHQDSPFYFMIVQPENEKSIKVMKDTTTQLLLGQVSFEIHDSKSISNVTWTLKTQNEHNEIVYLSGSSQETNVLEKKVDSDKEISELKKQEIDPSVLED